MSAKRLDVRALFGAMVALVLATGSASAQLVNGVWHRPADPDPRRIAVAPKPAPQVVIVIPPVYYQPYYQQTFYNYPGYQRYPVAYLVPAVFGSDGNVYANFGYGYELVVRPCSNAVVVGEPRVVAGNGTVLSGPRPPTYTQPVPNQATASQQMSSGYSRTVVLSAAAQTACYSRDAGGRVFVYQYR